MKRIVTLSIVNLCCLFLMLVGSPIASVNSAQAQQTNAQHALENGKVLSDAQAEQEAGKVILDSLGPCQYDVAKGSGNSFFRVCITNHGNIIDFETFEGENINKEGYILGAGTTVVALDNGPTDVGFSNPVINQPKGLNTLPLTITRTAECVVLKQAFARDENEKDITVTMTVTNKCGVPIDDIRLARYFDGDLFSSNIDDIYDRSNTSVWARDSDKAPAIMLSGISTAFNIATVVGPCCDGANSLDETSVSVPTGFGDFDGRVIYHLGTIGVNKSKTVKFVYRRA